MTISSLGDTFDQNVMSVLVQGLCKGADYARINFLGRDFTKIGKIMAQTNNVQQIADLYSNELIPPNLMFLSN